MAGQSPHSKGFRPIELMEGFSIEEVFEIVSEIDDVLRDEYGDDKEIKVVVLSFLLGRALRGSKINITKAFAMSASASKVGA